MKKTCVARGITLDANWMVLATTFGLNRPSALPASVVTQTLLGGSAAHITWKCGNRSTRYSEEHKFYQIARVYDLSHTATGLTVGKTLEIKIIAANETAETAPTETVSVVVG